MEATKRMPPMTSFIALPSGPWYVTLGVISAALLASKVIWTYAIWPFLRALWAAIVAAPQIAAGMHEVVALLQADVIGKLAIIMELNIALTERSAAQDVHLADMDARLALLESAVKQHDQALFDKEGKPQ